MAMIAARDIHKARILVVDDLATNVILLEEILREAGYLCVASTRDPHEVYDLHRKNRYNLILLDLQMPSMDGFQVMEGLKGLEPDGYLPVLVITAEPGHRLRALKAGAKDFISKPFEVGEVLIRVRNMLEVRLLHLESTSLNEQLATEGALLQAEMALQRTQAQLSVYAAKLEGLVSERTSELAAANKRLEESVRFIRKANGEHQALFLESQMIQRKLSQQARHIVSAQDEVATSGALSP
jgi:DNA-binding response OmpR family regulator